MTDVIGISLRNTLSCSGPRRTASSPDGALKLMFDEEIALDGVPALFEGEAEPERKSPRQVDQTEGPPRPEAEAVLAIIRIEFPMGAYPALRARH